MSENINEQVQAAVAEAEKQLAEAKDLLDKLRRAGEDVTQAETNYRATKLRVERYKKAFK